MTEATTAIAKTLAPVRPYPAARFDGRGIVVCAGGVRMFVNAYVLLRVLRETLRCALPIQLWHLGAGELSPAMRRLLETLEVELVDAYAAPAEIPARIVDGWQLKSYALVNSRFREVLLLDADQVPVRDPVEVFDWPQYLETGALFWPDIVDLALENPIWALCGLVPRRCRSFDSGQLAVDKRRHWKALQLALRLNEDADTFYQLIYGDKDTFLIGWLLADSSHALVPHSPFADPHGRIQRDFAGSPMFQHRSTAKWTYAEPQIDIPDFIHQTACQSFLAELRSAWNGRLFSPPERGLAARSLEASLCGARMRLIRFGEPDLELEFLAGHQFGEGRNPALQNWYVADGDGGSELIIRDAERDTYRLHAVADGRWTGRQVIAPHTEAVLAPLVQTPHVPAGDALIADLVAASGLAACWTQEAETELLAALRLINRASPGVAVRLRAYSTESCAQNPRLRQALAKIADLLSSPAPGISPVHRSSNSLLARHYRRTP